MLQVMSRTEEMKVAFDRKNRDGSSAFQIDYKQHFGAMSSEIERLSNPNTLINVDVADWEWYIQMRGDLYQHHF